MENEENPIIENNQMDLIKTFEEYLPRWSEEKMQPIPTREHPDRWAIAWKDFITEYVVPHKEEIVDYYKSMQFKTKGMAEAEKRNKEREQKQQELDKASEVVSAPKVEKKPLSEWERVQAILNED